MVVGGGEARLQKKDGKSETEDKEGKTSSSRKFPLLDVTFMSDRFALSNLISRKPVCLS